MSDRYKKEIEEILQRVEEARSPDSQPQERRQGPKAHKLNPLARLSWLLGFLAISPGKLMIAGVSLLLIALLLGVVGPGWAGRLVWAGLALFVFAYILFFVRPSPGSYEKRWRGRPLEDRTLFWRRVRRWFKR